MPLPSHRVKPIPAQGSTLVAHFEPAAQSQRVRAATPTWPQGSSAAHATLPDPLPATAAVAARVEAAPPLLISPPADQPVAVTGVELPLPLPLPAGLSGRRSLWSGSQAAAMDPQVAYLAQMQHQTRLMMQSQALAARGQYDLELLAAIGELHLVDDCRVVLPAAGAVRVECRKSSDADAVRGILARTGNPPPPTDEPVGRIMELAPDPAGGQARVSIQNDLQAP